MAKMRLNVVLDEDLYLTFRSKLSKEHISVTDFVTKVIKWYIRGLNEGTKPDPGTGSGSSSASQGSGSDLGIK